MFDKRVSVLSRLIKKNISYFKFTRVTQVNVEVCASFFLEYFNTAFLESLYQALVLIS